MSPHITASTFYQYLACPLQLWFELHEKKKKKGKVSEIQKKLFERGRAHETALAKSLGLTAATVELEDRDEAFTRTLELMKEGKMIYQGTLLDGTWIGRPDFLVPKRGKSRLGGHHYTVMDAKLAREVTDEHRFQLAFYALLLEKIQGVRPRYAAIINVEREEIRVDINEFLDEFHLTLAEIEKILAGEKPAPFLSSSCKESPWFGACVAEALACNDLSLLHKLRRSEYEKFRNAGIRTIKNLVDADLRVLPNRLAGISLARIERLRQQATALWEDTHIVHDTPELPETKVEVYYDVESDPLASPERHYLHGALVSKKGKLDRSAYRAFLVRNPREEGRAWLRFCVFIQKLPKEAVIYHYGRYEHQVIRELTARYGAPPPALSRLAEMIDLQKVTQRSVIFPVTFYSLKDIAKYLGFRWRHKEASGLNSIQWYNNWREQAGSAGGKKMLRDILEYNEDDVRATKVLKDFLAGLKTAEV
ncbi:TM0106 family RecB-like putative nuclease [Patescibacteria group bacterium]|nr:MAG: TM0106 family RecB-like putative nuclease [Patescibacteria group bacterium]